jgi:hypothetical protein
VFAYHFSGDYREMEQVFVDPYFSRLDIILTEPVPVKRGVLRSILHGIPDTFIDKCVKLAAVKGLNILREIRSGGHYRELPQGLFIDYE